MGRLSWGGRAGPLLLVVLGLFPACISLPVWRSRPACTTSLHSLGLPTRLRGGLVQDAAARVADAAQVSEVDSEQQEEGKWRPMCRICYDEEPGGLFAPCKCSGSMRYVHKACLRKWRAVNVRERGYTHCPMCNFEYRLAATANSPPDTWTYKLARSLATSECAVTATLLSLAVALLGESADQTGLADELLHAMPVLRFACVGPAPTRRRPGPWIPGAAPPAVGEWGVYLGGGSDAGQVGATSAVDKPGENDVTALLALQDRLLRSQASELGFAICFARTRQ
jgi:hypothetical protein